MSIPKASDLLKRTIQMQTLTKMDMIVIKNSYHIKTIDEEMDRIKLTDLLSKSSLTLRSPFRTTIFA